MSFMSETLSSPETPKYSREQVIAAYKQFVDGGITNPEDLPLDDLEVIEAHRIFYAWSEEAKRRAHQNPDPAAQIDYSVSLTTLYVDAGFSDPSYLDEIANDLLVEDQQEAEDAGLPEADARIQALRDEINARINQ